MTLIISYSSLTSRFFVIFCIDMSTLLDCILGPALYRIFNENVSAAFPIILVVSNHSIFRRVLVIMFLSQLSVTLI